MVDQGQGQSPATATEKHRITTIAVFLAIIGVALYSLASDIAYLISKFLLPEAGLPRSAGTFYPNYSTGSGYLYQLSNLGLLAFGLGAALLLAQWRSRLNPLNFLRNPRLPGWICWLLALATFAVYAYLAYPHNAWPSNARMHWVDMYFQRADEYQYALMRLIHPFFYEFPHVLVGLYGAAVSLLSYGILRRLTSDQFIAIIGQVSIPASSMFLLFANSAEDALLNFTIYLFVIFSLVSRRAALFGIACALAFLARPNNALLVLSFGAAYALVEAVTIPGSVPDRLVRVMKDRFLWTAALVFSGIVIPWHLWLYVNDTHFLLTPELNTYNRQLSVESIPIDGYSIERFGGAYFFHSLWIYPTTVWLGVISSVAFFGRLPKSGKLAVIGSVIFFASSILLFEYMKMHYFNVRYISYMLPGLVIAAWALLGAPIFIERRPVITRLLGIGLGLSLAAPYAAPIELKNDLEAAPESSLYRYRAEAETRFADCKVIETTLRRKYARNYLSYVFKRDFGDIQTVDNPDSLQAACAVIEPLGSAPIPADYQVVLETPGVLLIRRAH